MEVVQYIGGYLVHRRDYNSTVGDNFSTVEAVQYSEDNISTCEGNFQYCEGITAVHVGMTSVLWGIPSVLWKLFSTVGITVVQWQIALVLWRVFITMRRFLQYQRGDNISPVKGIQYSGGDFQFLHLWP